MKGEGWEFYFFCFSESSEVSESCVKEPHKIKWYKYDDSVILFLSKIEHCQDYFA